MTNKEILGRLEEIEAQNAAMREALEWLASIEECGDGFVVGDPLNEEHAKHCPECQAILAARKALQSDAGRDFLDRLHRLEAVAEAALEFYNAIYNEKNVYETWPDIMERREVCEAGNRLREALAALEEAEK